MPLTDNHFDHWILRYLKIDDGKNGVPKLCGHESTLGYLLAKKEDIIPPDLSYIEIDTSNSLNFIRKNEFGCKFFFIGAFRIV